MEFIFLAIALVIVARSGLGRALADRIRYGTTGAAGSDRRLEEYAAQVTEEFTALRGELTDLAERMDFAERTLLQLKRSDALPQGSATERDSSRA
jgi:NAD(P)-dependent dehydrogenase (short-subunit alcohol dehydrogenase family)